MSTKIGSAFFLVSVFAISCFCVKRCNPNFEEIIIVFQILYHSFIPTLLSVVHSHFSWLTPYIYLIGFGITG